MDTIFYTCICYFSNEKNKKKYHCLPLYVSFCSTFGFCCGRSRNEYFECVTRVILGILSSSVHNKMFFRCQMCTDLFLLSSFSKEVFYTECQIGGFCVAFAQCATFFPEKKAYFEGFKLKTMDI